jgi:hypothetical protein
MTQTAAIDHTAEALEALPHELGCFEIYAEELVEAGIAITGAHDEIIGGMTVAARFHMEMVERAAECTCQGPHDALIEG